MRRPFPAVHDGWIRLGVAHARRSQPAARARCDDDAAIRKALVRILNHWGYLVGTASNVSAGLELAKTWRPRVLILDLRLGGEDGRELLGPLHDALGKHAPAVLVCSGTEGGLPPGAAARVMKPFDMRRLVQHVHDLARLPSGARMPGARVVRDDARASRRPSSAPQLAH